MMSPQTSPQQRDLRKNNHRTAYTQHGRQKVPETQSPGDTRRGTHRAYSTAYIVHTTTLYSTVHTTTLYSTVHTTTLYSTVHTTTLYSTVHTTTLYSAHNDTVQYMDWRCTYICMCPYQKANAQSRQQQFGRPQGDFGGPVGQDVEVRVEVEEVEVVLAVEVEEVEVVLAVEVGV